MKITWLGQAGLLFEANGLNIILDPYLSDSVEKTNPKAYRRVPVDESLFDIEPDVMIFTHDHLDHYDPDTVERYIHRGKMTVLAPASVWGRVRQYKGEHNYVQFDRHTRWTENGIVFTAVKAAHSDPAAIGVLIDDGEKVYYVTGDTLHNTDVLADLPENLEAVFLPINGVGNNMNEADAADFARRTGARAAVPLHVGMLDDKTAENFPVENKVIPEIYKEIRL